MYSTETEILMRHVIVFRKGRVSVLFLQRRVLFVQNHSKIVATSYIIYIYLQNKFSLFTVKIFKFDFIFNIHFYHNQYIFFHPLFKSNRPMKGYIFFFSQTPFSKCTTNISFRCHYPQVTSTPVIKFMQNAGSTSLVSDVTEFISTEFPLTLYSISEKKCHQNCPWQATNINAYS